MPEAPHKDQSVLSATTKMCRNKNVLPTCGSKADIYIYIICNIMQHKLYFFSCAQAGVLLKALWATLEISGGRCFTIVHM